MTLSNSPAVTILACLLFQSIEANTDRDFIAYDCSSPQAMIDTGYVGTPGCLPSAKVTQISEIQYQILQYEDEIRQEGYACKMEESKFVHYCGTYDHQTIVPTLTYVDYPIKVSTNICRQLRKGTFTDPNGISHSVLPDGISKVQYETLGHTYFSSGEVKCRGQDYNTGGEILEQIMISVHRKFHINNETFLFGSKGGTAYIDNIRFTCPSSQGACDTDTATYIWDPPVDTCPLGVTRISKGKEVTNVNGDTVFISTDGSLVRLIKKETVSMCGRVVYKTNYDNIYLAHPQEKPFKRTIHPGEVSLVTYINNRDDYLYNHLKEEVEAEFHSVMDNDCKLQSRQAKLQFWLQHNDPGLTTWFLGNGTFATSAGEVIYQYLCRPVAVRALDHPHCYRGLPVVPIYNPEMDPNQNRDLQDRQEQQQDRQLFMEPLTHRLTYQGIVIPCSSKFVPKYRNAKGDWVMALPMVRNSPAPKLPDDPEVNRRLMKTNIDWSRGGIYTVDELNAMEEYQDFSRTILALNAKLAQQVTSYTAYQPLRPEQMFPNYPNPTQWFSNVYDKTKTFLRVWGEIASIVVSLLLFWQAFKTILVWTYNFLILRDVHGCTKQLLWFPCINLLMMHKYRSDKRMDVTIEEQIRKDLEVREAGRLEGKPGEPGRNTTEGHRDNRLQGSVVPPTPSTLPPPPRYGTPSELFDSPTAAAHPTPREGIYPNVLAELHQKIPPRQ